MPLWRYMSKELIVSATSLETKVAVVEEDQVTEIFIERTKSRGILGNIYKGKTVLRRRSKRLGPRLLSEPHPLSLQSPRLQAPARLQQRSRNRPPNRLKAVTQAGWMK